MYRTILFVTVLAMAACSSRAEQAAGPQPSAVASVPFSMPERVGDFVLTERTAVVSLPDDSLFRYSDGSAARVSVILYDPGDDVRGTQDPQQWTAVEGVKFIAVQQERKNRGQIADYVVSISDTSRISAGSHELLEHFAAIPVRSRAGAISVEMQHLYLIGGRFVKVRATIPEPGWQQSKAPLFARDLARLLARGL